MDDQPNPLSLPPEAPARRRSDRADRADRPGIEMPASAPVLPDFDVEEHRPPPGAPPPRWRWRWRGALRYLIFLVIALALILWLVLRSGPQAPPAGRFQTGGPMPVGTATAEKGDMPVSLSGLGTVTPLAMVTVKTQINGQLIEVAFKEGQMVNKGDFLAQIDPRPYQVALEQAEGQLAKDQAALKNAEVDLTRYKTLVAQNSVARQTLDTQAALVQQDRGVVQADHAQVDAQKLNLTYCRIVALVGGRVGLRQVDAGNYVQTSDPNGIVVITQLQPISAIFTLPEDNLPVVTRRFRGGATLPVTAFDRSGAAKLGTGRLDTIDNQIDTSTGTVKLRAVFDNPDQSLFPNQFVNIQLLVDTLKGAVLVPNAAIQRGAPGTFVYVVKPDETVTAQPVTLGPGDDQRIVVTKGLEPGQIVVIDGADRLKDGAKVRVTHNAPAASAQPQGEGAGAATPAAAQPSVAQPSAAAPSPAPAAAPPGAPANPPQRPDGQRRRSPE
jgi:multidrug efflux system membrane fusion protein